MNPVEIAIQLFVVLFAITIHEASHGWAAKKMGDTTAYDLGRVSLNPLAHIDPVGTILLPLMLVLVGAPAFGWAKPVPVNPYRLRNPRRDNLIISAFGPLSNIIAGTIALLLLLVLKFAVPSVRLFLQSPNLARAILPKGFYPLEGLAIILFFAVFINYYFAVFNLIPIPPLDGSGIVMGLLSERGAARYERIRPYGFFILIALLYLNVLSFITLPIQILISLLLR
ncbi:MAG: site-2 protease family protein [Candidatus Aminicenantes bacterium]|nr:site-2 protease family protein [Candidatus Aminicenantes bacterium]